jgi:hypothetical protein
MLSLKIQAAKLLILNSEIYSLTKIMVKYLVSVMMLNKAQPNIQEL